MYYFCIQYKLWITKQNIFIFHSEWNQSEEALQVNTCFNLPIFYISQLFMVFFFMSVWLSDKERTSQDQTTEIFKNAPFVRRPQTISGAVGGGGKSLL